MSDGSQLFRFTSQQPAHRPFQSAPVGQDCGHPPLRPEIHRLAFRLPHCLGRFTACGFPSQASMNSGNISASRCPQCGLLRRLKSASGRQTPCRVKSLLYVDYAAKKRHGGFRRRIKEKQVSRLPSFSESQKTRPFLAPPPHRGQNPARSVSASARVCPSKSES